jgi:dTMP kinase
MKKMKLQPNKYSGKLIVFEGVDGCGKTTILGLASEYFKKHNIAHVTIKMPSDRVRNNPIFHDFDNSTDDTTRNTVNLEHLSIFVGGDRLLTLDTEIIPALKMGKIVLCDRYCYTGYVRCTTPLIHKISEGFIKPNLVIMPAASPQVLKQRVTQRENEKNNYYNETDVKLQIDKFAFLSKKHKFITLNTEQAQNKINKQLYTTLNQLIKNKKDDCS